MLKILSGTFIVILTITVVIYAVGLRKGPEVQAEIDVRLNFSREYIFDLITNVEMCPERKRNLDTIEILERRGSIIVAWRENYKGGDWRSLRILEKNTPKNFTYEIFESKSGYTSTISYTVVETTDFTNVIIKEDGQIPGTFARGLRGVMTDDSFLDKQAKWLRVAIQRELIERE